MKMTMTTRRGMVAFGLYAVALWSSMSLSRTLPIRPHLPPTAGIPGAYSYVHCPHTPYGAKFLRLFLGRPWPGNDVCPRHPESLFLEDPGKLDLHWWRG